jgi:hypothetical protein
VPQTEEEARPGLEPIRTDKEGAEAQHAPDWNEPQYDSGQLGAGLNRRTEGADTTDTVDYRPWWAGLIPGIKSGIEQMNEAQDTKGTAAAREIAGQQGHGTMQYADSIDPVIRPGAAYGNDFFRVLPKGIQDGSPDSMTPIDNDSYMHAVAQSRGVQGQGDARKNLYGNFYRSL